MKKSKFTETQIVKEIEYTRNRYQQCADLQEIARRKLRMLNNSQNVMDLQVPPSNRLEKLN